MALTRFPRTAPDTTSDLTWWEQTEQIALRTLSELSSLSPGTVACLETAAVLHGATPLGTVPAVHVLVPWHPTGLRATHRAGRDLSPREHREMLGLRPVVRHCLLPEEHPVETASGHLATSLPRTMRDCARFLPVDRAVAVVDSLLARAVGKETWDRTQHRELSARSRAVIDPLIRQLSDLPARTPGRSRGQQVLAFASALAESPRESSTRRLLAVIGAAPPVEQLPVLTTTGTKYLDHGWYSTRTGLETSGAWKGEGPDGAARLAARAARSSALADEGWRVIDLEVAQASDTVATGEWLLRALPPAVLGHRRRPELATLRERRHWWPDDARRRSRT